MGPEKIVIDFEKQIFFINSCNVIVPVDIGIKNKISINAIHKTIHIKKIMIIFFTRCFQYLLIHHFADVSKNENYLFESNDVNFSFYVHLINAKKNFRINPERHSQIVENIKKFPFWACYWIRLFQCMSCIKKMPKN